MAANLPQDIIISEIISRLPVKSVVRFKSVSKTWFSLLSSPSFVKRHLDLAIQNNKLHFMIGEDNLLYSIDPTTLCDDETVKPECDEIRFPYGDIQIVGSCDGLLCLTFWTNAITLLNPSTFEFKNTPYPSIDTLWGPNACARVFLYGFGYDPIMDDYKVVRMVYTFYGDGLVIFDEHFDFELKIYTLRTNSWRKIEYMPHYLPCFDDRFVAIGVFVNGALHWNVQHESNKSEFIVALDLGTEEFKDVLLPDDMNCVILVGALRGCLCIIVDVSPKYELWLLKDTWTKLFTIHMPQADIQLPLYFSKIGELFMENGEKDQIICDKNVQVMNFKVHGIPKSVEVRTYVESLVSLKSGVFVAKLGY